MTILITFIWVISVIIYFFSLRMMLSKDIDLDIDELYKIVVILIVGFIPLINIAVLIVLFFDYVEYNLNIEPVDILKKILFIKDKRDKRWR